MRRMATLFGTTVVVGAASIYSMRKIVSATNDHYIDVQSLNWKGLETLKHKLNTKYERNDDRMHNDIPLSCGKL